jgi:SAM-dependent methyltransferase
MVTITPDEFGSTDVFAGIRLQETYEQRAFAIGRGDLIIPQIPAEAYDSIFDFGCGCGRFARQLLQQRAKPRRYVGVDVHKGMIDWCAQNLTPIDPAFRFFHHDVFSAAYAPTNSRRLVEPFPVSDGEFSLLLAHSVFTHVYRYQAEYYLYEVARILGQDGLAYTTWLLFDRASFPFLGAEKVSLFVDEVDPTAAVIFDRAWLLDAVRRVGLAVRLTVPPEIPGHQWLVLLEKRRSDSVDRFPLGEEDAEWLCGATAKPIAKVDVTSDQRESVLRAHDPALAVSKVDDSMCLTSRPPEPPFSFGPLDPILAAELAAVKQSWTWKIGRTVLAPLSILRKILPR